MGGYEAFLIVFLIGIILGMLLNRSRASNR
jgi:hypothetical protein